MQWQPGIGEQATALMSRQTKLNDSARDKMLQTAAAILGRGQPPQTLGRRTGLVVGYVQSGKTLSFTTVVALARDNRFPVVIVVAGTSEPLFKQTHERLSAELNIDDEDIPPAWMHILNPGVSNEEIVRKILADWRDPDLADSERATLLLTVMKQHQRLSNLNDLLRRLELEGVPTIIIDDEADQASLNTKIKQGNQSTTYQRLIELKSLVPCHSFIQYTATPQAPLFINIIDELSPDFVEVLDPGVGYVGGTHFFANQNGYARIIPPADIPSANNPVSGAPPSLLEALAFFIVSVAIGLIGGRSRSNPNRSMLVHPSRTTLEHFQYFQSIRGAMDDWLGLLNGPSTEPDRVDLIGDFQRAYTDLIQTVPDAPTFDAVLAKLPRALRETQVREVNTRGRQQTPSIEWKQAYGWILVGGQAMDRGFTVRELSVTYMPRGPGVGNADTLQQRARFFGYKDHYAGHCRLYLEAVVLTAFQAYVEHEEEMRDELKRIQSAGTPLRDWKRRFILDPALRPCRSNVIEHDYVRGNYSDDWFHPAMVKLSEDALVANRETVRSFVSRYPFAPDTSYVSDQPAQQHLIADNIPLRSVVEDLILNFRVQDAEDAQNIIGLLFQLNKVLEDNGTETVAVYQMRPSFTATRGIDADGRIPSIRRLHQGPTRQGGGYSYPGDRAFHDPQRVSVQIHVLNLEESPNAIVRRAVPVLAIWVPRRMEADWITQHQPT